MELIRTFHPIGQGGFYSEKFYENDNMVFSVVYDCGSFSPDTLENEINNTFINNNDKVNVLFISHFHQDHINRVEYLIDKCKVDYIFIPEIDEEEKMLILSSYNSKNRKESSFLYKFLINPQQAIKELSEHIKVIFIKAISKENNLKDTELLEFNNENIIFPNFNKEKIFINSGSKLVFKYNNKPIWEYVFNNFKDEKLSAKIKSLTEKYSITLEIYKNFIINRNHKKRGIDKNIYSLILYSGPVNKNIYSLILYFGSEDEKRMCIKKTCEIYEIIFSTENYFSYKIGCLYTGDFNLNIDFDFIKNMLENNCEINFFQIPHHGSKHSWNSKYKNNLNNKFLFLSAGTKNKYSHPHKEVLMDILSTHCCYPRIISEDKESKIEMKIHIF